MTETKKRSTRVQKMIDDKLSTYFKQGQLDDLSEAEIDILNDYFSNHQLRELANAPAQVVQGLVARHVKVVERQRLTNIPDDEVPQMLDYYKEVAEEVEEVICQKCGNRIAIEIKHKDHDSTKYFNNPNLHWQGRFVIAVGSKLFGYRKRHDDVMGYRCGAFIENPDYTAAVKQFEKDHKKWEAAAKKAEKAGNSAPTEPVMPAIPKEIPCGNESTMAEPELEAVSDEHLKQSVITESDIQKIKRHINKTDYKKPVKKVKDGYLLDDKFLLRKVQ